MQKIRYGLAVFVLLLSSLAVFPQEIDRLSKERTAKIEALIKAEMEQGKIPGLSLALVRGDEIIYANGFGLRIWKTLSPQSRPQFIVLGRCPKRSQRPR